MSKTIKWGILATGNIANQFAKALVHVPNAQLWAVGSRNAENAKQFAEHYGAPHAHGSYEELAANPEVDVVYIATPHVYHFQNTILCLEHGKAVLCEKPFAMDYNQVIEMVDLASRMNLFLMEALWTRFLPGILRVKELIDQGVIGEIVQLKSDFGICPPFNPDGRLFSKSLGGGSLLDIGIYPVFISLLLLGEPTEIFATARMGSTNVDESISMIFGYNHGVQSVLHSTILSQTATETDIYGTKGRIRIHREWHIPSPITLTLNEGTEEHMEFPPICNGYEYEAMEVTQCLLEGRTQSSLMTHDFSIRLIKLLDRIRERCGIHY